ncbi:hypothetical protein [Caulobacter sp. RL271]|nr:hypothetical protein [Caulobacter segnis]
MFLQGLRRTKVAPIGTIADRAATQDMPTQVRKIFWLRRVDRRP